MKTKINTKLRKGDMVIVISGKYKTKKGKVLEIDSVKNRATIDGVNLVKKTMKKTQENPKGGIMEKEGFVHLSNVMFLSADKEKGVRLGYTKDSSGKKKRFLRDASKKVV